MVSFSSSSLAPPSSWSQALVVYVVYWCVVGWVVVVVVMGVVLVAGVHCVQSRFPWSPISSHLVPRCAKSTRETVASVGCGGLYVDVVFPSLGQSALLPTFVLKIDGF